MNCQTGVAGYEEPRTCREALFKRDVAFTRKTGDDARAYVIINGAERFFSQSGAIMSAELDVLFRAIAKPRKRGIQWLVSGSSRIEAYFRALEQSPQQVGGSNSAQLPNDTQSIDIQDLQKSCPKASGRPSEYLLHLEDQYRNNARSLKIEKTLDAALNTASAFEMGRRKGRGDLAEYRRSFYAVYLNPQTMAAAGVECPELALDILTVMAFIGSPVELPAIWHAPRVQQRLATINQGPVDWAHRRSCFQRAADDLMKLKLTIPIQPFQSIELVDGSSLQQPRVGLHKTLISELRDRLGVPLSESKLATAFNLSLYSAQPIDGLLPEQSIHRELGDLVDHLTGAWKDLPLDPNFEIDETAGRDQPKRIRPHCVWALRSALQVVRGYYTTTALLTADYRAQPGVDDGDGVLAEHAERLDRILKTWRLMEDERKTLSNIKPVIGRDCSKFARSILGAFYKEELVWFYNERGVIRLAQGDLYEARDSLNEAARINNAYVEFGAHSHNWRRITINQIHVDIERGRFRTALQRITNLESAIGSSSIETIDNYFKTLGPRPLPPAHPTIPRDDMLCYALAQGYRGLTGHLQGELQSSAEHYKCAVHIFRLMGEQRAFAMFQRNFSGLRDAFQDADDGSVELTQAIAAAESARQMDISYLAHILRAMRRLKNTGAADRRAAMQTLNKALAYSHQTGMHRVRVEARLVLAQAKLESGDHDDALEQMADALAIATRYGMSLRKIRFRTLMAEILYHRGDRLTSAALLDRAIHLADRVGYQRAVELTQKLRAELAL